MSCGPFSRSLREWTRDDADLWHLSAVKRQYHPAEAEEREAVIEGLAIILGVVAVAVALTCVVVFVKCAFDDRECQRQTRGDVEHMR